MTPDQQLMDDLAQFYDDPLGYVMYVFPWEDNPAIRIVELPEEYKDRFHSTYGPDKWACEFLEDLGAEVRKRGFDGRTAVDPIRFSTASGHGIGKSTLVAWLIKWILDTRPYSKGVVTANTSDQLRTKTWAEVGKWHKMSLTEHLYEYGTGKGAMTLKHKMFPEEWRCDAMTCREENAEAFQGLHAAGGSPFYIFDEASGIPDAIFSARSGGATDGEPMWFDFGNPTRKSGYFYEDCIGRFKHRFNVRHIDSRSVAITNKDLIEEWRQDYGEESDFFKVKVRGVFPSAGTTQFISNDVVTAAMQRPDIPSFESSPLVIGVDVARFGDDNTVIYPRIGYDARSFGYKEFNGLDTWQVAEEVIKTLKEFEALGKPCAGLFIDEGNMGAGVIDILRRLGYSPFGVNFQGKSSDRTYAYKVDQMWGDMRDALHKLALPYDPNLRDQLTQREFGYRLSDGAIRLERKQDMKERLGGNQYASPDTADALALTFALEPMQMAMPSQLDGFKKKVKFEYNPLEETW